MRGHPPARLRTQLLVMLGFSSAVSLGYLVVRMLTTSSWAYWFLAWNLALGWLPLFLGWWLLLRLRSRRWSTAPNIILTLLWLGFLPNSFYIASDFVHLSQHAASLYDVVMFLSFTFSGFLLGYVSVFGVHARLRHGIGPRLAGWLVATVLLLCSFAIYLGRYLRWNSWDVLVNPAGLVFDVSEPFVNPSSHPQVFTTTLMFFVLIGGMYVVCYNLVAIARQNRD